MRKCICSSISAIGALFLLTTELSRASADGRDRPARGVADKAPQATGVDAASTEKIPEMNLLEAKRQGLISIQAEGRGDGRMTVSVTNRTKLPVARCFAPRNHRPKRYRPVWLLWRLRWRPARCRRWHGRHGRPRRRHGT